MSGRVTLAASLTLAGGVAAGVGSFLTWAEVSAGPLSEQASGISGWEGSISLGLWVVIAGGTLGLLGAIVSLGIREPVAAGSTSGLTGWAAPSDPRS